VRIGFLKQYCYLERDWEIGGRIPTIRLKSWSLDRLEFRSFIFRLKRKLTERFVCRFLGHKFLPTTCSRCFSYDKQKVHAEIRAEYEDESRIVSDAATRSHAISEGGRIG
jgi:hypothetical protein